MGKVIKQSSYQKKYKCPYCEERKTRDKLERHIEKYHKDLIPKGYTASRVAFNTINKKDHGNCIICKEESPWNENKKRYERLCGKKSCHKKYVQLTEERLKNKTGKTKKEMLKDEQFQKKMLNNRSISGKYKFSNGIIKNYVGSYEKKFLEFMDNFFKINPDDILMPGPTIEYDYKGKKHKWITDAYYIPYNLVFDIKDGGKNPNNRPMPEYREKQIAKEKSIEKLKEFNYIRLTDNDFEQLILLMMELKDSLIDFKNKNTTHKPIIRINEGTLISSSIPSKGSNDVYMSNYMKHNSFSGDDDNYAIHLKNMDKFYIYDDIEQKFKLIDREYFLKENQIINTYKYKKSANIEDILKYCKNDKDIYYELTGKKLLDSNQLLFDKDFENVIPITDELESIYESVIYTANNINNTIKSELFWLNESGSNIQYWRDINGVYATNGTIRTKSYNTANDIPLSDISVLI